MQKKQLFSDIQFEYEGVIAFDATKMGLVGRDVEQIHRGLHEPYLWSRPPRGLGTKSPATTAAAAAAL